MVAHIKTEVKTLLEPHCSEEETQAFMKAYASKSSSAKVDLIRHLINDAATKSLMSRVAAQAVANMVLTNQAQRPAMTPAVTEDGTQQIVKMKQDIQAAVQDAARLVKSWYRDQH